MMNRTLVLTLAAGSVLSLTACNGEKEVPKASAETVRGIQVLTVQRSSLPSYYEAMGTVRPVQSAQLSSQVMGNIIRMTVREGDRVSRGEVLAVIDDSQTHAALDRALAGQRASSQDIAAASSEYELAESTLKRYQVLQDKKSVSPHEFEEVSARYQAARARLAMAQASAAGAEAAVAQARTSQGYTTIRAPFSGTVTAKLAESGNLATPGVPLYTVEDSAAFRLEVSVDESNAGVVHLGATVPVAIDAVQGTPLTAKVVQILPAADAGSRSFIVKLELPKNPSLRTGLFGRAQFPTGTRKGFSLPQSAVVHRGSMQAVYTVGADQVASLRYVTLGQPMEGGFEILSGLENGDRVVLNPGEYELNGRKVEVR